MSVPKLDLDCTSRCRSVAHGSVVTATLSVPGASEEAMVAHLRCTCANYCQVVDSASRTALHMAATCGTGRVAEWLVRQKECNINAKDGENGFTALHRSVFYGNIHVAVSLIQLGASTSAVDGDELTAVEHAMLDRPSIVDMSLRGPCEVYVWGTNANYTLGTGNQSGRQAPDLLETFRKQNISIKQASMHKFHTVFVSHSGVAYSCGHGQGGRLGLGTEQAALSPRAIKLPESCVSASVSRDHTLLLTETGNVYSCGLNTHHQLGVMPPPAGVVSPQLMPVRAVKAAGTVAGVCAGRFHSVVWGDKAVLTCGLNAGQLGHSKTTEKTVVKPKAVASVHLKDAAITQVATSDAAVVIATNKGQIFLLHAYECRRIAVRQTDVAKVAVVGGQLDSRVDKEVLSEQGGSPLQVLVLTKTGRLLIWQESLPQFTRCSFTLNRLLLIQDVAMTENQILFVTRDGEAFIGELKPRKAKKPSPDQSPKLPASSRYLEKADCEVLKVSKLPHIHRAVSITSDIKGSNFSVIQSHPKLALFDVPQLETSLMRENMKTLLQEANEMDTIHDVIFQVGYRKFPAHQFVIKSRNSYLGKLITEQAEKSSSSVIIVNVENIHPDLFEQFLQYIYTNACDMLTLGKCPVVVTSSNQDSNIQEYVDIESSIESEPNNEAENISAYSVYSEKKKSKKNKLQSKRNNTNNESDPIVVIQKVAKRFYMSDLFSDLNSYKYEDGFIVPKGKHKLSAPEPRWSRNLHPELLDVVIRSESGQELRAHKCILTSRLEYFYSMFCQGWSEAKNVVKLALPFNIVEILVDFLYEDLVSLEVRDSDDFDLLCNLLVVADQMFVTRLKEQCEISLVNVLTLKTAAELLQLSETYLADQLKRCCMQFISFNLSAILESRSLEGVSPKLLLELSQYYRVVNPAVQRRMLAAHVNAPSIETLQASLEANPFSFDTPASDHVIEKVVKQVKRKPRTHRISNEAVRARKESTSSVASDDVEPIQNVCFEDLVEKPTIEESQKENMEKFGQWVKIPTNKQQKILQARLKAINASKDSSFIAESSRETFTTLLRNTNSPPVVALSPEPRIFTVKSPPQPVKTPSQPIKPITASDFPELSSPPTSGIHHKPTPRHSEPRKHPIQKLSQKQRKKLTEHKVMADHLDTINSSPPGPAWGANSPEPGCSLVDIIRQELRHTRVSTTPEPTEQIPMERTVVASNPWNRKSQETKSSKCEMGVISFTDIVAIEKMGKDNLTKMLAKPLELLQIEDRAMSDLLLFYNASGAVDERITVQRMSRGPVATPMWITNH